MKSFNVFYHGNLGISCYYFKVIIWNFALIKGNESLKAHYRKNSNAHNNYISIICHNQGNIKLLYRRQPMETFT